VAQERSKLLALVPGAFSMSKEKKKKKKNKNTKVLSLAWTNNQVPPRLNSSNLLGNQVYKMSSSWESGAVLTSSTTVFVGAGINFQLGNIPAASQLATVFDQYRIDLVEVWITPRVTAATGGAYSTTTYGNFCSVIDYDDSNTPATIDELTAFQTAIITNGLDGHYHRFTPHAAFGVYSGTFTSFGNITAPWIDAASLFVQHYGLKIGITATTASQVYDMYQRLTLSFRNTR